jgi:hypothetical protein
LCPVRLCVPGASCSSEIDVCGLLVLDWLVAQGEGSSYLGAVTGAEVRAVSDTDAIVEDPVTGLFGFRLEMGRDHGGIRMQARRSGFVTAKAAKTEYGRLCRQRDALRPRPRLSDSVQNVCEGWILAREQELEPNTVYGYRWLLGLIYQYVGRVRASRLSARMVERAYRGLEECGYSRTTLRTLNLVLAKAFTEQVGRTLGVRKPRESDDERPVWSLAEARRFCPNGRTVCGVVVDRVLPSGLWRSAVSVYM